MLQHDTRTREGKKKKDKLSASREFINFVGKITQIHIKDNKQYKVIDGKSQRSNKDKRIQEIDPICGFREREKAKGECFTKCFMFIILFKLSAMV